MKTALWGIGGALIILCVLGTGYFALNHRNSSEDLGHQNSSANSSRTNAPGSSSRPPKEQEEPIGEVQLALGSSKKIVKEHGIEAKRYLLIENGGPFESVSDELFIMLLAESGDIAAVKQVLDASESPDALLNLAIPHLAESNPQQASTLLTDDRFGTLDPSSREDLLKSWAAADADSALEWLLESNSGHELNNLIVSFAAVVSRSNPSSASKYLEQFPFGTAREEAVRLIAESFSANSAEEAQAWFSNLPVEDQAVALGPYLSGLSQADPELAVKEMESYAAGDSANERFIQRTAVGAWAHSDPQAALEWAREKADSSFLMTVVRQRFEGNPDEGLSLIEEFPGEEQPNAARELLISHAHRNPEDAFIRALNYPDTLVDYRAFRSVAFTWIYTNPEDASVEIDKMPKGERRDIASAELVNYLIEKNDLDSASYWAESIGGAQLKQKSISKIDEARSFRESQARR